MNRIFQIGLNKCGTLSIHRLFSDYTEQRLNSVHWENGTLAYNMQQNLNKGLPILTGYDHIEVFTDMETHIIKDGIDSYLFMFKYYQIIDQQYPNSKFILNTRNIYNWIISRLNHQSGWKIQDGKPIKLDRTEAYYKSHMRMYGVNSLSKLITIWEKEWHDHHNSVIDYFKNRQNDLLIFNIESDSIDKIKSFFPNIAFMSDSFPKYNETKVFV